jgi:hypothetical protein
MFSRFGFLKIPFSQLMSRTKTRNPYFCRTCKYVLLRLLLLWRLVYKQFFSGEKNESSPTEELFNICATCSSESLPKTTANGNWKIKDEAVTVIIRAL